MAEAVTIAVSERTKESLEAIKRPDELIDTAISRLLEGEEL